MRDYPYLQSVNSLGYLIYLNWIQRWKKCVAIRTCLSAEKKVTVFIHYSASWESIPIHNKTDKDILGF